MRKLILITSSISLILIFLIFNTSLFIFINQINGEPISFRIPLVIYMMSISGLLLLPLNFYLIINVMVDPTFLYKSKDVENKKKFLMEERNKLQKERKEFAEYLKYNKK